MRSARRRILTATVASLLCMLAPVACGPDPGEGPAAIGEDAATTASTIAETFDLPFGLIQPAGVVPIGRPVVYEQDLYSYNGVPVRGRSLRAAYRVTDPDPVKVVRALVERLDGLTLDEVSVRAAANSGAGPKNLNGSGAVTEPKVTDMTGTQIVEAGFVISAGGWGFDVVAVRAPQDPYATLYVTSAAD